MEHVRVVPKAFFTNGEKNCGTKRALALKGLDISIITILSPSHDRHQPLLKEVGKWLVGKTNLMHTIFKAGSAFHLLERGAQAEHHLQLQYSVNNTPF